MKTIGVLTGGGDCPGMNAVIRAVLRGGIKYDFETLGIRNGWQGLIDWDIQPLDDSSVAGILSKGGTILGTSRTNPLKNTSDFEKIKTNIKKYELFALIVVGGNGTLSAARDVAKQGIPLVGVPKTIDNDICGTDVTFGFDTAITTITDAIDHLRTTAESHHRIMVVEIMGRNAGWLAVMAGMAGGADEILIPEVHFTLDEVCTKLQNRYEAGKRFSLVVISEGVHLQDLGLLSAPIERDDNDHEKFVGVGNILGKELESRLGIETRVTILGYVQRGGSPTANDRILATRFGVGAVELVHAEDFGKMVALQGNHIINIPLEKAVNQLKTVDNDTYNLAMTVIDGRN
ncbi:6-phosphofructokinase [Methanospirillum lacunae]|uniref:ATP-dependent 6-phosphofructokinase n=1 Tax=Methanospirillum lacunae TaxID=668570 RepID=A0A2V2N3G3_9EURY|nr:ATP-dependent 6-phosphofructokinase [Methanospirillum lacunae]PWR69803.1 6-phosphofructokinase [Methanospirillum lacunae]